VPYHTLISKGYIISSGERIGGYYSLEISSADSAMDKARLTHLKHLMISSPYVDGSHQPDMTRSLSVDNMIHVRLLVKEEDHIHDLIEVLEEQGYHSAITKS